VITQERLKEQLTYNPETGLFTWNVTTQCGMKVVKGTIAGSFNTDNTGYTRISIDCKSYQAHRLACFYMTGKWPIQTDHNDHIRSNNRWNNLRFSTHQENARNTKLREDNTSGIVGVCHTASKKKFRSFITNDKKQVHLGIFSDFFDACCARKSAEYKYGYHENHGMRLIQFNG